MKKNQSTKHNIKYALKESRNKTTIETFINIKREHDRMKVCSTD